VVVSCFFPGATVTGFQKRAGTENSRLFKKIGAMNVETVVFFGDTELAGSGVGSIGSEKVGDRDIEMGS
jgi:hypothetical protein